MDTTSRNESLQCIACALRQFGNIDITEQDLINAVMDWDGGTLQSQIVDAIGIEPTTKSDLIRWVNREIGTEGKKHSKDFDDWIKSSVLIANELANCQYLDKKGYKFYRQDQFADFKNTAFDIATNIKENTSNTHVKQAYGVSVGSGWKDKWNPADILAIKRDKVSTVESIFKNFDASKYSKSSLELRRQNLQFQQLFKSGQQSKQLAVIYEMDSLYEYNKVINQLCDDKECVGISLKKQQSSSVPLKKFDHKDVKGLQEALDMKLEITKIEWLPSASKAIIWFSVGHGEVFDKNWNLDVRGTESGKAEGGRGGLAGVQLNLMYKGGTTAHGKASMSVFSFLAKNSGGMPAIRAQHNRKKELFGDRKVPLAKGTLLTDHQIFESYISSGASGGYRAFAGLWRNDLPLWIGYIDWLTGSKVQGRKIIKAFRDAARFAGQKANDYSYEVGKGESKKRRTKDEWARMKVLPNQKKLSRGSFGTLTGGRTSGIRQSRFDQMNRDSNEPVSINWTKLRQALKYLKNKVQAYEIANVFDKDNGIIQQAVKEDIMKGVYSYAASKGLRIFTQKKVVDYMTSSSYIKVGGT